jgi:hypothetical protein
VAAEDGLSALRVEAATLIPLPSQHGSPSAPHALQLPGVAPEHEVPEALQKFGVLAAWVTQHASPFAPPQPPHDPLVHIPKLVPQVAAGAMQVPAGPQHPSVAQVLFAQHGVPLTPQVVQLPFEHTCVAPVQARPLATHLLASQHPPPAHAVVPVQQACPGSPQSVHLWLAGSHNVPATQALPAQQTCPFMPHGWHPLAAQAWPAPH